jgi:hypothetical protein
VAEFGEGPEQFVTGVGAVGEEVTQPRKEVMDSFDNKRRSVAVLHIGGMSRSSDHQAGGIGHDMPLSALDLLGGIVAARPAALSRLDRLAGPGLDPDLYP